MTDDVPPATWLERLRKIWAAPWRRKSWIALIRASILLGFVANLCTIGVLAHAMMT